MKPPPALYLHTFPDTTSGLLKPRAKMLLSQPRGSEPHGLLEVCERPVSECVAQPLALTSAGVHGNVYSPRSADREDGRHGQQPSPACSLPTLSPSGRLREAAARGPSEHISRRLQTHLRDELQRPIVKRKIVLPHTKDSVYAPQTLGRTEEALVFY